MLPGGILTHIVSLAAVDVVIAEARKWFDDGCIGPPPQPAVTAAPADVPSPAVASADAEDVDADEPDAPPPLLATTTTRRSLPDRTFGAHHPKCLAQLPPLIRDSLPFRHIPGVGYVTHELASILHKFGTTGTCAGVMRSMGQLKLEQHYLAERLRAQLWVEAERLDKEVCHLCPL